MKSKFISILAIIFGLLIIIFPIMGVIGISDLIGLSILLISIYPVSYTHLTLPTNREV